MYQTLCFLSLISLSSAIQLRQQHVPKDLIKSCSLHHFENRIDHFCSEEPVPGYGSTFKQKFYVCKQDTWKPPQPIFYYVGNEAQVELYLNNSGLMWENADEFGAMLVFGEHRYFGSSVMPFPITDKNNKKNGEDSYIQSRMKYLSVSQSLSDHANLIEHLRNIYGKEFRDELAVIGFGGSYGGMLAAWLSLQFPKSLDGLVAGSAPIFQFLGQTPKYDGESYARQVSFDASAAGGASDSCFKGIRSSWQELFKVGKTAEGRVVLTNTFKLCKPLQNEDDVQALAYWLQSSFDYYAMGSYPYPSDYMLNGFGTLPPYPMKVACHSFLDRARKGDLLAGLSDATSLFFNATHNKKCYDFKVVGNKETSTDALLWGYLSCQDMLQPMYRDGKRDMFWDQPFNLTAEVQACKDQWGIDVDPLKTQKVFGGLANLKKNGRNMFFTNGALDPWISGGVTELFVNPSIYVEIIPNVGHHIDLMFSNDLDTKEVRLVREKEKMAILKWIKEKKRK